MPFSDSYTSSHLLCTPALLLPSCAQNPARPTACCRALLLLAKHMRHTIQCCTCIMQAAPCHKIQQYSPSVGVMCAAAAAPPHNCHTTPEHICMQLDCYMQLPLLLLLLGHNVTPSPPKPACCRGFCAAATASVTQATVHISILRAVPAAAAPLVS
jgi:hypothetical protein